MSMIGDEIAGGESESLDLGPDLTFVILRTIEAGWDRTCPLPNVDSETDEVEITEHLRDGMRKALKDDRFPWGSELLVLGGTETRSSSDVWRPDGLIDIPIIHINLFQLFHDHDPHAIIECKRIAGSNPALCRLYVLEGIDRFATRKYGRQHQCGFMIGYLIAGNAHDSTSCINRYLVSKGRASEMIASSNVIPKWTWVSFHNRSISSDSITLHHVFLKVKQKSRHLGSR